MRVPAETSQRLACDASRVVMRHDADGNLLEVGARTRTIPPALRRALQDRDRGCRFPGCGVRFGQGHHVRHWAHGGPTTLANLCLLCRRHGRDQWGRIVVVKIPRFSDSYEPRRRVRTEGNQEGARAQSVATSRCLQHLG